MNVKLSDEKLNYRNSDFVTQCLDNYMNTRNIYFVV